jgi:hypothetical protein
MKARYYPKSLCCAKFVNVTKLLKTMMYLVIAFGIFLMAVGVAFLNESRKSDQVN